MNTKDIQWNTNITLLMGSMKLDCTLNGTWAPWEYGVIMIFALHVYRYTVYWHFTVHTVCFNLISSICLNLFKTNSTAFFSDIQWSFASNPINTCRMDIHISCITNSLYIPVIPLIEPV